MAHDDLRPARLFDVESIVWRERVVISLRGELDIAGVPQLDGEIERAAMQSSGPVVLDLRGLDFIDGTGVRAVLGAALLLGPRLTVYPGPPRVHRVFELTEATDVLPFTCAPGPRTIAGERTPNVEFVRRLWHAFRTGGADAMARLVSSDVEWRPSVAGDRVLRGPDELRSFWAARRVSAAVRVTEFRPVGDDVLVRCEYPLANGATKVVWSLYQFSETVLQRAETYASEREALAHAV
jgi:anti-anti-sigma factor